MCVCLYDRFVCCPSCLECRYACQSCIRGYTQGKNSPPITFPDAATELESAHAGYRACTRSMIMLVLWTAGNVALAYAMATVWCTENSTAFTSGCRDPTFVAVIYPVIGLGVMVLFDGVAVYVCCRRDFCSIIGVWAGCWFTIATAALVAFVIGAQIAFYDARYAPVVVGTNAAAGEVPFESLANLPWDSAHQKFLIRAGTASLWPAYEVVDLVYGYKGARITYELIPFIATALLAANASHVEAAAITPPAGAPYARDDPWATASLVWLNNYSAFYRRSDYYDDEGNPTRPLPALVNVTEDVTVYRSATEQLPECRGLIVVACDSHGWRAMLNRVDDIVVLDTRLDPLPGLMLLITPLASLLWWACGFLHCYVLRTWQVHPQQYVVVQPPAPPLVVVAPPHFQAQAQAAQAQVQGQFVVGYGAAQPLLDGDGGGSDNALNKPAILQGWD